MTETVYYTGSLVVSAAAVEDDVRVLRSMLIDELGLDQPDKDPNQFRYSP